MADSGQLVAQNGTTTNSRPQSRESESGQDNPNKMDKSLKKTSSWFGRSSPTQVGM